MVEVAKTQSQTERQPFVIVYGERRNEQPYEPLRIDLVSLEDLESSI